jgi:hypothetical protein
MSNPLRLDAFVSAEIPVVISDLPPRVAERRCALWSSARGVTH